MIPAKPFSIIIKNVENIPPLPAGAILLILPGAALLAWLPARGKPAPSSAIRWLADAVALSIALSALAALISSLLDVRWTRTGLVTAYGICGGLAAAGWLFQLWRDWKTAPRPWFDWQRVRSAVPAGIFLLAALAALGGMIFWRLYQARELVLPAWVDSVHHTWVVQKILAAGGLPPTLGAELPVPFYYHYGFHLITSIYCSLTGTAPADAVLNFGQAVNALIALAVFRLAIATWQDWKRAALAALLVAFVMQMPAYYVTWGRTTLSTGLVLLPAAMAAMLDLRREHSPDAWARLMILTAGICLTHYLAMLLLAFFAIIVLVGEIRHRDRLVPLFTALSGGVLLALPWLWILWTHAGSQAGLTALGADGFSKDYVQYLVYLTGPTRSHILMGAAVPGLVLAFTQPQSRRVATWALLMALLTLPWLRIDPFRPDLFAILLFLPASLLAAHLLVWLSELAGRFTRPWLGSLLLLPAAAGLLFWGINGTRNVLNQTTILAQSADLEAIDWIRQNTPPDARFWINSTGWQGVYRGVDGGYWLMPLASRWTLTPPALYSSGAPDYVNQVQDWSRRASQTTTCSEDFHALVSEAGLTHLYLKTGVGSLQPAALANCSDLLLIYQRNGISLYEITRP